LRRALANLLLATVSTVVALALAELALRVLDLDVASYHAIAGFTTYDSELGWRLAPSRETIFRGAHFAVRVAHNAAGLRDRDHAYDREPGRRRILVLGDSAVWGWGVEQAERFTERLEAALPDVDVINTGVPGWSTAQEMLFYEREGRRYRPDVVLLLVVPNDPWENVSGPGPRFRLEDGRLVGSNVPVPRRTWPLAEWLQAHSRVFGEASYVVAVADRILESGVGSVRSLVAHVRARSDPATSADARSFADAAPPRGDRSYDVTEALLARLAADIEHDGARFGLVFETMPRAMAGRLQRFCAARGLACVDLGPPLHEAEARGVHTRLRGDPHLGPEGQQVAASTIRDFLTHERLLDAGVQ